MTKARVAALQWFHDRGEVVWFRYAELPPSQTMRKRMIKDGQLEQVPQGFMQPVVHRLTDLGRQALHEATA